MRLVSVDVEAKGKITRLVGKVERRAPSPSAFEVSFEFTVSDEPFAASAKADAFAAAMLMPCMQSGEPLHIVPPISPRLLFNLPRIRDIFHTWWPHLARVSITAESVTTCNPSRPKRAGTFFSGGVDSFYSLLKYKSDAGALPTPLSHLIFMKGIENKLEWGRGVGETESWIRDVASSAGVSCIIGETNIRTSLQGAEVYNPDWERYYFGSDLAGVSLALSSFMAYVCIPSAFDYNHLVAHGSTPLVDEMYSTESTHILHDGSECSRANKVAKIVKYDCNLVLNYLRVCHMNYGGAFNCGQCPKCVRTAVPLQILGLFDRAKTFQNKSFDHWAELMAEDHRHLTEDNLKFALEHDADKELISMIKWALRYHDRRERSSNRRQMLRKALEKSPIGPLLPTFRNIKNMVERTS
ncbi:hypothetical protein [Bradyrhizobium sp. McL0615]|uniref:hypothetical protein n=1 Tax=Bradyrhizobium sp. McL0615 TaxID=3415673 RepID=UPI003CF71F79